LTKLPNGSTYLKQLPSSEDYITSGYESNVYDC
jgi:hypothetical protein